MGGVTFEAGGARHELRLGSRACRAIERRAGLSVPRIIQQISGEVADDGSVLRSGDLGFETAAMFFVEGLAGGKGVTEEEADAVIDALGGLMPAAKILGEAMTAAFPVEPAGDAPAESEAPGDAAAARGKPAPRAT